MPVTLITFLGGTRGKDPKQPYESAQYQFDEQTQIEANYFAEALLRSKKHVINQIILIGTRTSIWEHLINDLDEDLHLRVFEKTEGVNPPGVSEEMVKQIQDLLSKHWNIKVLAYAGTVGVNAENVFEEFMAYNNLLDQIPNEHEVLLDFTHGFRSMPILLMSALQFKLSLSNESPFQRIRLIYGELNRKFPSPVHYLDDIWEGIRVSQAARLFFEKFEGKDLAEKMEGFWKKGAVAIRKVSHLIQSNFFNRIEDPLRELNNALEAPPHQSPPWFDSLHKKLHELHKRIYQPTLQKTLLALAYELAQNKLYGQAFIALDEALLETVLSIRGITSKQEKWEAMSSHFKEAMKQLCMKSPNVGEQLRKIHNTRNAIAHGGRQTSGNKGRNASVETLEKEFGPLYQTLKKVVDHPDDFF